MAKQFDKPLGDMTYKELVGAADELGIKGAHSMKREVLQEAIEEALTQPDAPDAPDTEPPTAPDPSAPEVTTTSDTQPPPAGEVAPNELLGDDMPPEVPADQLPPDHQRPTLEEFTGKGYAAELYERHMRIWEATVAAAFKVEQEELAKKEAGKKKPPKSAKAEADAAAVHAAGMLTDDDRRTILAASDEELTKYAADDTNPPYAIMAVLEEIERRKGQRQRAAKMREMTSDVTQYKITAGPPGMRYVTKTAYVTTLPIGSLVGPLTHDLEHVAQQGFSWEPIKKVVLTMDQLGNQVSTPR